MAKTADASMSKFSEKIKDEEKTTRGLGKKRKVSSVRFTQASKRFYHSPNLSLSPTGTWDLKKKSNSSCSIRLIPTRTNRIRRSSRLIRLRISSIGIRT